MADEEGPEKIKARVIIEILGKPKEHVEKTLKEYVDKIKEDKDFEITNEKFADAKEQDNMWAAFVELEFLAKGMPALMGFSFDYMPSSIEVIEPEELKIKYNDLSNFFNDLQAKLHNVDMAIKQARNENQFLRKNTNTLLRNLVTVALHNGPKDLEKLSKITGVVEGEMKKFLATVVKLGIIQEEKGTYSLKNE